MSKLVAIALVLAPAIAAAQRYEPDRALTYAVQVDGYPSDGPADAKVTLVIAHDYADPYSERNRATLDDLRKKYGNELRVVFRNMVVHPRNAMAGALASCAAHKQKRFDMFEDKLWEAFRQRQWDASEVDLGNGPQKCWETPDGCPIVVGIAKDLGLKVDRFKSDMQACVPIVKDDMTELSGQFRVQATPTFFINGRYLSGAQPVTEFEKLVDEEMAKASAKIRAGTPKARYYKIAVIDQGKKKVDPPPPNVPGVGVGGTGGPTGGYQVPRRPEPDRAKTYAVPVDGYPSRGPADAKVTIVIAYDYTTPYAWKNRSTLDELVTRYGNDLRIVYRQRIVHPMNAMASAVAACAAHKQGKFAAMDAALWDKGFNARQLDVTDVDDGQGNKQKCWESQQGCSNVTGFAKDIGLDVGRFRADLKTCAKQVAADDTELGTTFLVMATPSFFINGRFMSGAMPTESFAAIIDEELIKATDRIKKGTPKASYYRTWIVGKGDKKVAAP
jgi:protein-disulfide isomerase